MNEIELPTHADALLTLDAVATTFLVLAAPVDFRVAESAAEREAVYRLRYHAIIDREWAPPEDFPNGLEQDGFDERAVQIAGWDGNRLAAAGRMVFPIPGQRLPTEEAFETVIETRGQVVDWSRTVVARHYSARQHRLLLGVIGKSWMEMRRRGFSLLCGVFTASMIRLYQHIGIHYTILSAPRQYWGEERFAARLDVLRSAEALSEKMKWAPRTGKEGDPRTETYLAEGNREER